ncbi:MAG TPA: rRNA maturation RNase YbeY [Candidatus Angelobacter sp.]|nr:rRNA maturation RNase YbeY [Candidatus Angelobacter sp.]
MVILEKRANGVAVAELNRFVRQAQALAKVRGEVGVLIAGNARVQELNRRFRNKNKPTDVLSFPRSYGGDIAISADIARDNARLHGHRFRDELKILILHGMLHLAGYDHETDKGRMAAKEIRLRAQLKLPASLIDRTVADGAMIAPSPSRPKRKSISQKPRPAIRKSANPKNMPRKRRSQP